MAAWRNSILEDTLVRETGIGPLHYWDTANLKGEYPPNKVVIKIVVFVEFGTVLLLSANIGQCKKNKISTFPDT